MKITILSFGADWIPREWEQLGRTFSNLKLETSIFRECIQVKLQGIQQLQIDTLVYLVKLMSSQNIGSPNTLGKKCLFLKKKPPNKKKFKDLGSAKMYDFGASFGGLLK